MNKIKYSIIIIIFSVFFILPFVFFYQEYLSVQNYYIENFGEFNLYYEDELSLLRLFAIQVFIIYYPTITIFFFLLKSIIKKRAVY